MPGKACYPVLGILRLADEPYWWLSHHCTVAFHHLFWTGPCASLATVLLRFSSWIWSLTSWPWSLDYQLWLVFLINLPWAQLSSMLDPNFWNHLLIPEHAFILPFWLSNLFCTALAQLPQESWEHRLDYAVSLELFASTYEGLQSNSLNFFSPSFLKNLALCLLSLGNLWALRTNRYFIFIFSFCCLFPTVCSRKGNTKILWMKSFVFSQEGISQVCGP